MHLYNTGDILAHKKIKLELEFQVKRTRTWIVKGVLSSVMVLQPPGPANLTPPQPKVPVLEKMDPKYLKVNHNI